MAWVGIRRRISVGSDRGVAESLGSLNVAERLVVFAEFMV
jgi:hypothetical protein